MKEGANVTGLNINGLGNTMVGVGNNISRTIAAMSNALNETLMAIKSSMKKPSYGGGGSISGGTSHNSGSHQIQSKPLDAQHKQLALQMLGAYGDVHNWNPITISWLQNAGYDASTTDVNKNAKVIQELIAEWNVIMRGLSISAP